MNGRLNFIEEPNLAGQKFGWGKNLAGGPGFEPRLTESESVVLPLNYPPTGACTGSVMLVKTSRGRSLAKQGLFDKPQTMIFAHLQPATAKAGHKHQKT